MWTIKKRRFISINTWFINFPGQWVEINLLDLCTSTREKVKETCVVKHVLKVFFYSNIEKIKCKDKKYISFVRNIFFFVENIQMDWVEVLACNFIILSKILILVYMYNTFNEERKRLSHDF